jgi:hypothetical protein
MKAAVLASLWPGALLLVPSGAHLLEMPHKLAMDREAYYTAQQLYLGWALFGIPIVVKIVMDAGLALLLWRTRRFATASALLSALLIAAGLAVFFVIVQPANLAMSNWSVQPPAWQALRTSWEYGHLAIALLTIGAFASISCGAIEAPSTPAAHDLRN